MNFSVKTCCRLFTKGFCFAVAIILASMISPSSSPALNYYYTDFSNGQTGPEFSGGGSVGSVLGFAGKGSATSTFGDNFLRNAEAGSASTHTVLTLEHLEDHVSIDLNFLLGIIDSWEGFSGGREADYFNVAIDGDIIFHQTFDDYYISNNVYDPPAGTEIPLRAANLGWGNDFEERAYDLGMDPLFDDIAHSADSLTIEWYASGAGWQGGDNESWGIDNVEVILNRQPATDARTIIPNPEPGTLMLIGGGMLAFSGMLRRYRRHE